MRYILFQKCMLSLMSKVFAVGFQHQNYSRAVYTKWCLLGYSSPSLPAKSKCIVEFLVI